MLEPGTNPNSLATLRSYSAEPFAWAIVFGGSAPWPALALLPLLLHLLLQAIDPAVELIDALAVLLGLARRRLRLGERLTGRALHRAQPSIDAVDPGAHVGDLPVDIALCGAAAEADRSEQDQSNT